MHSEKLYERVKKFLKFLEFRTPKRDIEQNIRKDLDVLIFGYDRIGFSLIKTIENMNKNYTIIDYNPEVIKKLDGRQISCVYGDASDNDFIEEFDIESVNMMVSTIPDLEVSMSLLKQIKKRNRSATVILTADHIDNALELYREGADYVILPHFLGGDFISNMIEKHSDNLDNFLHEKVSHIKELKQRKEFGFEHPKHLKG